MHNGTRIEAVEEKKMKNLINNTNKKSNIKLIEYVGESELAERGNESWRRKRGR